MMKMDMNKVLDAMEYLEDHLTSPKYFNGKENYYTYNNNSKTITVTTLIKTITT